jgi:PAS domain S-box-containing protein
MSVELDSRYMPLIFENIAHGIFTIDDEGRITSFNRAAEELTGYVRDEVLGRPCYEVFQADLCDRGCLLKKSMATGEKAEEDEVTIRTKDGRPLPIAISTAALVDSDGGVHGGVEMFRDMSQVRELRKRLTGSYVFEDIVSKSPAMHRIFETLPLVARSDSTVLIEGPSGTGKELIARAIHNLGPRRDGPFIAVNCSALPDNLLESELFGYVAGAFTDARKDKPGRFALAAGGTLLLDEMGEMSLALQSKLLRVLEQRDYEPLGSTKTERLQARIVASTNRDLGQEVRRRRFRQDLYFRLNVVRITLPSLAERSGDIPLLVDHFIRRFNALQGRHVRRCSERAMSVLLAHGYSGNVRELENAIEHAFVVCAGDTIQEEDLPAHMLEAAEARRRRLPRRRGPLESAEAKTIRETLERHGGNRGRAAKELGISRTTLWRKMKRYGLLEDEG